MDVVDGFKESLIFGIRCSEIEYENVNQKDT
jgi:hypothetical protein